MKILWLYQYIPSYNFDHWLHMAFAGYIANTPGIELKAYGPRLDELYSSLTLTPYHDEAKLANLYEKFPFDAIIICTKSRSFFHYNPHTQENYGFWFPSDFAGWKKTPKVVLEEDYHYERDDAWYVDQGIDLILQRHYSQSLRQQNVPMKFFPFSVDPTIFCPSESDCRICKVAFVGNLATDCYRYRRDATNNLVQAGLGVSYAGERPVDGQYIEVLQKYVAYLSCGSTFEICAAKNFEIMAAGGVLFTNAFLGYDQVFDPGSYVLYSNDASDVVRIARRTLDDGTLATIREKSKKCIETRHTHDIRIKELLEILKELQ